MSKVHPSSTPVCSLGRTLLFVLLVKFTAIPDMMLVIYLNPGRSFSCDIRETLCVSDLKLISSQERNWCCNNSRLILFLSVPKETSEDEWFSCIPPSSLLLQKDSFACVFSWDTGMKGVSMNQLYSDVWRIVDIWDLFLFELFLDRRKTRNVWYCTLKIL